MILNVGSMVVGNWSGYVKMEELGARARARAR